MTPPPSLLALFLGFLAIGACGFGGVLPWARRTVVERRHWLSAGEFTELLGLCQFLPGPNVINLSVALGARFHGLAGSVAAFGGLMATPMSIVLLLGLAYARLGQLPAVQHAFAGLSAAAAALVLATACRIAGPLCARPLGAGITLLTFGTVAVLRLPLPLAIVALAPVSIVLAWRAETRPR
ncbi:MAG TPA: chromate transporter [Acetobacteraceae bacterium]|nr:chromate transporter [Acetobacteraceae bacterium]